MKLRSPEGITRGAGASTMLVPEPGIEPGCPGGRGILSPLRLPIPPLWRGTPRLRRFFGKDAQHLVVKLSVGRDHFVGGRVDRRAVEAADPAARLFDEQRARDHIPRFETLFEVAVDPSGREIREIESRGAVA